jgi:hypothetical protein
MIVNVILIIAAAIIVIWLLGVHHILAIASVFHLSNLQFLMVIVLILIIFALMLRR